MQLASASSAMMGVTASMASFALSTKDTWSIRRNYRVKLTNHPAKDIKEENMKEFKLFATLIQVAFIVMKLCGAIHWSWLLVFSPILLYLFRFVLAFFCVKHEIKQSQENFLDRMDNLKRLQQEYQDAVNKKQKELEDKRKEFMEQNNKQTMPDFELGNLYVFKEEDEDGELTIIGKLISKNENEDTLTFGNQYEIETENFVTDQAFNLRISIHKELREATEDEASLFQEAYTLWKKSKEQPSFKPFDKVLVRNRGVHKWRPAIFVQTRIGESPYKYNALLLSTGHVGDFTQCIPYEGNEKLAFTAIPF